MNMFDGAVGYVLQPERLSMAVNSPKVFAMGTSHVVEQKHSSEARPLGEKLFDNGADLKIILAQFSISHLDMEIRSQLLRQIDWLLDAEHWEAGDSFPNVGAFKTLIKFILNAKPVASPSLGLSDSGNLLAMWVHEANRLTLECMPNDLINYAAMSIADGKKKSAAGRAETLRDILELLSPFKNAGWFRLNGENRKYS